MEDNNREGRDDGKGNLYDNGNNDVETEMTEMVSNGIPRYNENTYRLKKEIPSLFFIKAIFNFLSSIQLSTPPH